MLALGQTVPPVAVLAIAVPLIGFGALPALIALALYGVLPVLRATIAGLESVPAALLDAARGQGLTRGQRFRHVELPQAAPVLLAGIRTSVVINIGTAAIASTVGCPHPRVADHRRPVGVQYRLCAAGRAADRGVGAGGRQRVCVAGAVSAALADVGLACRAVPCVGRHRG